MSDSYIELARQTILTLIKKGKILKILPDLPQQMLTKKAGVFVSIHKKSDGELRGCVGTFLPTCKNIAGEIIQNAISASTNDPRFSPIIPRELEDLQINVDILSPPEPTTKEQINPKRYGLIIKSSDNRLGLLLPHISEVKTAEEQIRICRQKAGIGENEPIELFRFTVERHRENVKAQMSNVKTQN